MANITPDFNVCLQERGAQPALKKDFNIERINTFLQEAYSIVWHLTERTTKSGSVILTS